MPSRTTATVVLPRSVLVVEDGCQASGAVRRNNPFPPPAAAALWCYHPPHQLHYLQIHLLSVRAVVLTVTTATHHNSLLR